MLETGRLLLDTWRSSDWTALRPIATDRGVMRYITGGTPWSDERIRDFVDRQVKLYTERGFCRWKLVEKATGAAIGFCGVGLWPGFLEPEIGWWLARRCWGRGLATEAARVALDDVFERVRLDRVVSVAMRENTASTHIMKKLGLEFETEFESAEGVRLVLYAIHRGRWESMRQPAMPLTVRVWEG
jgi:[ribosomal protein S5]-alanine N-acetyltransferase